MFRAARRNRVVAESAICGANDNADAARKAIAVQLDYKPEEEMRGANVIAVKFSHVLSGKVEMILVGGSTAVDGELR